ncbi:MAG: DUF4384 domain-containing protein [candidate division Zixibacteria bacterium]|nr:DUF4384 domain-containing protein [candidate division Zixibacteria bacterium]
MKFKWIISTVALLIFLIPMHSSYLMAQPSSGLKYRHDLEVDVWTNKEDGATFYRGEDLVVYFRTNADCYVLVYEIDTDGNIHVLYPADEGLTGFVQGGKTNRIPPPDADYHIEVGGSRGDEYIYAIASDTPFKSPGWMLYWGYEYEYVGEDWIIDAKAGRNDALNMIVGRLAAESGGKYVSDFTSFFIEAQYRHYFWYPKHYHNYGYGSVWVGVDYPGCEIYIDGVYYGIAPVYVPSLLVGGHVVLLYYNGYPCWQRYFWVHYGGYYRFYADVDYYYIRHIDRGVRYKYWSDWDFGGKDYRRPPKYKDGGGYTYKNPEKVVKPGDSKYRDGYKKVPAEKLADSRGYKTRIHEKSIKHYGDKSMLDTKTSSRSNVSIKEYETKSKDYGYKSTINENKEVDIRGTDNVNIYKPERKVENRTVTKSRLENRTVKKRISSSGNINKISQPKSNESSVQRKRISTQEKSKKINNNSSGYKKIKSKSSSSSSSSGSSGGYKKVTKSKPSSSSSGTSKSISKSSGAKKIKRK